MLTCKHILKYKKFHPLGNRSIRKDRERLKTSSRRDEISSRSFLLYYFSSYFTVEGHFYILFRILMYF